MTYNLVPRANLEGEIGSLTRRWLTLFAGSVDVVNITDGDAVAIVTQVADVVAMVIALAKVHGVLFCDLASSLKASEWLTWNEDTKRLSIGIGAAAYTLDIVGDEPHPVCMLRQINPLGRGLRIMPGSDDLGALEITDTPQSHTRHTLFGSGVALLAQGAGSVSVRTAGVTSPLNVGDLVAYASNALAIAGGLVAGAFYRTGGDPDLVCVVHAP